MLNDNSLIVTSIDFITDECARTTHRKRLSTNINLDNRNLIIASFVTAYARLELYDVLDRVGKDVLYYDTDSYLFVRKCDSNREYPKTRNFLGDLTNKLEKPHCSDIWIEEFYSM